jgi:transposase
VRANDAKHIISRRVNKFGGRPSLWTEDVRAVFQTLLEQTPDRLGYFAVDWTVPLFQDALAEYTGRRPSEYTIRRELDRLGYVWKRSRSWPCVRP